MIVKMKKASLIVLEHDKEASLKQLRKLGVMHIDFQPGEDEKIKELSDKEQLLLRGLNLLPDEKDVARLDELERKRQRRLAQSPDTPEREELHKRIRKEFALDNIDAYELKRDRGTLTPEETEVYWFELANQIFRIADRKRALQDEIEHLKKEEQRLMPWGSFELREIAELQSQGIWLKFYQLTREELERIPAETDYFIITEDKFLVRVVAVGLKQAPVIPGEEIKLPEYGLRELRHKQLAKQEELTAIEFALAQVAHNRASIKEGLHEYNKRLEFEQTKSGMSREGKLSYLTGYIPIDKAAILQTTSKANSWALLLEEPESEDPVPTLIRNNKLVRMIKPMFDFLGVIPGYREYDMSLWFLLYFSVFFAMIVGDGGYGIIFLILTLLGRILLPKAPAEPFVLLVVMSLCTIAWGAMTGTWFSSPYLAQHTFLANFVVPGIATFPLTDVDTNRNIMFICFILGVSQLTLAHTINFIRTLPNIKAIADLGWISILWGMYFLVQIMVMKADPNTPVFSSLPAFNYTTAVIWLVGVGAGLVFAFGRQEGNFIKGFLFGLAFAPLTGLSIVSAFADIISYVRLFAVGLASVEVAKAFNNIASGIGFEGGMALVAALILFLGHALNITMSSLSIIVHGVRLNMLEFSGHLGLEWSGIPYRPFKEDS